MSWLDANEIHVFGSGMVYVAPVGTALPTTPTAALNAAFFGLGYLTPDGVTLGVAPSIQEIFSWQARQATRREMLNQEATAKFAMQQFNEVTLPLALGGGSVTSPSTGVYRYELPPTGSIDEKCLIIDAIDGTVHNRIIIPRGNVSDAVETKFAKDVESQLPIAFKALQPADGSTALIILNDDAAAFAAGS